MENRNDFVATDRKSGDTGGILKMDGTRPSEEEIERIMEAARTYMKAATLEFEKNLARDRER